MSHSMEQVSKSGHQIGKKSKFQSCPNEMKFSEYLVISVRCSEMNFLCKIANWGIAGLKLIIKG